MAKDFYFKIEGRTYGPITLEALKKLATEGNLKPSDKVASGSSGEFLEARSVSFLNDIFNKLNKSTDVVLSSKLDTIAEDLTIIRKWVNFWSVTIIVLGCVNIVVYLLVIAQKK